MSTPPSASHPVANGLNKSDLLRLYEPMALIRHFEMTVQELCQRGVWPGFIHLYPGEEAVAVGVGAELAAAMMELSFDSLDAPVGRLHTEQVSFPFSPSLESAAAVTVEKIVAAGEALVAGCVPIPKHP